MRKKYIEMLKDPDIKRWYDNLVRGSQSTADVRLRGLGRFCSHFDIEPKGFLMKSEKEMSDMMMDYVTELEEKGKAPSYIDSCLKPIRSWLKYNSIVLTRPIKIRNAKIPTTLKGQRTPSQEQLKKIIESGTMASKVCISLVAQSGLRLEVLGNYKGGDGLTLRDFPELQIFNNSVDFEMVPARIIVKPTLSKAGHEYFTFIGTQGTEYIKDYLNYRLRKGEELTVDSPVIIPRNHGIHFITTINIGDQIRGAIRKAGFSWRPYDLRHYFATQTLEAESKGAVIRDWRVFFMGHKGDIEHQYTLNNRTLSKNTIEEMRSAYSKCQKFLETEIYNINEEDMDRKFTEWLLRKDGFSEEEIESGGLLDLSDEELLRKRRERLFGGSCITGNPQDTAILDRQFMVQSHKGSRQKVISNLAIEAYLNEGFEFVSVIPGDKVIVRLP